jgi:hypothetical protein
MRAIHSAALRACVAAFLLATLSPACSRQSPSTSGPVADASGLVELSLRVPAALAVTRALDTLSVAVDPDSLGLTQVTAHAGTVVGVETGVRVFRRGQAETKPLLDRHAVGSGPDFDVGSTTWSTGQDGLPVQDTKYVVEMHLVLFETEVPKSAHWDPHAGHFRILWTRTLRQAEE